MQSARSSAQCVTWMKNIQKSTSFLWSNQHRKGSSRQRGASTGPQGLWKWQVFFNSSGKRLGKTGDMQGSTRLPLLQCTNVPWIAEKECEITVRFPGWLTHFLAGQRSDVPLEAGIFNAPGKLGIILLLTVAVGISVWKKCVQVRLSR